MYFNIKSKEQGSILRGQSPINFKSNLSLTTWTYQPSMIDSHEKRREALKIFEMSSILSIIL